MTAKLLIDRGSSGEFGSHALRNHQLCPRRGLLSDAGIPGDPVDYHVRGNLGHVALAHLYKTESQYDDRYLSPEDAVEAYAEKHPTDFNAKWIPRVRAMLIAYRTQYNGDPQWKVLGVEEKRMLRVTDPETGDSVDYSMRFDLEVLRKRDQLIYYVDHKFTFGIIPKVINRYRLDGQILGLLLGGRAKYKEKFGGVRINFIQLTPDAIDFKRPPLRVPWVVVKDYKKTILEAHRIRDRWAGKPWDEVPGVFGEACDGRYGACPYLRRCGREVLDEE